MKSTSAAGYEGHCLLTEEAAQPEDVLVEAGGEGIGQLVTEEAEVVEVQGSPNLGPHITQHPAEHIHKVTLIPHLYQTCACVGQSALSVVSNTLLQSSSAGHVHRLTLIPHWYQACICVSMCLL